MATSTVAGAKREATPAKSRPLTRLLRYVLPYSWPLLASVTLMALVGLLDAFRVLLIGPIFNRVLNPDSQDKTLQLFQLPGKRTLFQPPAGHPLALSKSLDSRCLCPGRLHRAEGDF